MLPVIVQYNVSTTNSTTAISLASSSAGITAALQLNGTYGTGSAFGPGVIGTTQQRITVTSGSSDTGIYFHIVGLNQAGYTIAEFLVGGGAGSTVQSNLDYRTILSIQPSASSTQQTLGTTASTVSAGLNGVGSSLWNIVNWHVTPVNLEYGTVLQTGVATWSIQYTYDDPNNLSPGVTFPQAFNHPTIVNATATIDGASNDPLTAWRLLISAGTGTVRAIGIQGGISGP